MSDTLQPAGFFRRLFATLLDFIIFLIIPFIVFMTCVVLVSIGTVTMEQIQAQQELIDLADYTYRILFLCFCIDCEASNRFQGTLGKYVFKIKIVNEDGSKLSLVKAASRFVFKIISLLLAGIGFLIILINGKKLGLHDMILNTKVVFRN